MAETFWEKEKILVTFSHNVFKRLFPCFWMGRNILRKGENADHQHFLLFSQCFQKPISKGLFLVSIVLEKKIRLL